VVDGLVTGWGSNDRGQLGVRNTPELKATPLRSDSCVDDKCAETASARRRLSVSISVDEVPISVSISADALDPTSHQNAFLGSLFCDGSRRNPATCGAEQGN
jgi:hypothetical protein